MKELKFRDLSADEIEVRVGTTTKDKNGNVIAFNLMLYKTARTDYALLDETVGVFNWQKKYYQVKNTMVCSIGIYNEETKEWIWKDDGGDDDTTMEQVKSELSDAGKRAGFAWGIGRKLYTASKIFMRVDKTESNTERSYYQVSEIAYDETSITKLVIINKKTKEVVISFGSATKPKPKSAEVPSSNVAKGSILEEDKKTILDYVGTLSGDKYKQFFEKMSIKFGVFNVSELNETQGRIIAVGIKNGK